LAGEEFPGPVEAGEDFIGDKENFFLVANEAEHGKEIAGRRDDPTPALEGLDEDATDVALGDGAGDLLVNFGQARGRAVGELIAFETKRLLDAARAAEAMGVGDPGGKVL